MNRKALMAIATLALTAALAGCDGNLNDVLAAPGKPTAKQQVAGDYDRILAAWNGAAMDLGVCRSQADQTYNEQMKKLRGQVDSRSRDDFSPLPWEIVVDIHARFEADRDACQTAFDATVAALNHRRAELNGKVYDGK